MRGAGDRIDTESRARRARARAHLDRVRTSRARRFPPLRVLAAGVIAISFGIGGLLGDTVRAWAAGVRSIDAIAVRGARHLTPEEVAEATGVGRSAALVTVDPGAVAQQLLAHDWIAAAEAVRWRDALVVDVVERAPLAVVALGDPPSWYVVDASGVPFAPARPEQRETLPRLVPAGPVAAGEPSAPLARAVRLAQQLPEHGLARPSEVAVPDADDAEGFALRLPGLGTRFVLGHDDLDARLGDLARLIAARPDEVARAERADFRFEDQVVLQGSAHEGSTKAAARRGRAAPSSSRPSG